MISFAVLDMKGHDVTPSADGNYLEIIIQSLMAGHRLSLQPKAKRLQATHSPCTHYKYGPDVY